MIFSDDFKLKLRDGFKGSSDPSFLFSKLSEEIQKETEKSQLQESIEPSPIEVPLLNQVDILKNNLKQITEQIKKEKAEELKQEQKKSIPTPTKKIIPQKVLKEEVKEVIPQVIQENLIEKTSKVISREESNKITEVTNLFSVPSPETSSIKSIQDKLKSLESWIYKISAAGPGGGEVNFRWLDDVNRSSIGNTDQILRYNPSDKKFFFGQLSGDQGPINSLLFANTGAGISQTAGTLEWNDNKDCLNVYQNDGTILQVGLENYIRVHNVTSNTIYNGTLVTLSGVNGDRETPTCVPLVANTSCNSLHAIGVLTTDILSDEVGRATRLGEIHDLNTTGSEVSETWSVGDLLYAHPVIPGKLTITRPTAPDVVIYIGTVLKVGTTDGIILVKPVFFPRLYYGSFFDTTNQTANNINTAYPVKLNTIKVASGFHVANTTQIVAEHSGLYNYQFSIQIRSSISTTGNVYVWYRKNGQDVANSATKISISSNRDTEVAAWNFIESMNAGDDFELMWATDNTNVFLDAEANTAFCPGIPSVILTTSQVTL